MKTIVLLFASVSAWAGPRLPLWFEPNQGQAHASVQFLNRSVYLGAGRVAIHAGGDKPVVMDLIGARKGIRAEGLDKQPGVSSCFLGNDPKKWRSGVPHFARVRYRDVYPGIDVIFYGNENAQLEYDFVVKPRADPNQIQIAYNQPVREDANGDLVIAGVRQRRPKVMQGGHQLACQYVREGNRVQLALASYDHTQPLSVDPTLVFSTYLGGPANETGLGVQVDAQGNIYLAISELTPANPSLNPFQQVGGGSYAAFAVKFSPDGKTILWYAYVGGTGATNGYAIALDSTNNVYLAGSTSALDFPVKNAAQPQFGGGFNDAFIAKISSDGLSLVYASYIGGENEDEGYSVAVDSAGDAYVGGFTYSFQFPAKNSLQPYGGGADGYISELSPDGSSFVFSTYLGGSGDDYIHSLALDNAGAIYVTGGTTSSDFPIKNAIQSTGVYQSIVVFLTKISPSGGQIVYSTYLGGTGVAIAFSVAVDTNGNAYVSGATGAGFAVKNAFQPAYGGGQEDIFLMKIDPAGSNVIFSTYLGGSDLDFQNQNSMTLDQAGNVFVTGFTYSVDFPVKDTLQPFASSLIAYRDNVFVTEFTPSGNVIYSTLFGGHGDNRGEGIAVDSNDDVYVTGLVNAPDFPVLNAFQSTFGGGGGDAFLFKLAPDALPPPTYAFLPGILQFQYIQGGSVPAAQTVSISGAGSFVAKAADTWLTVAPSTGTTPTTLTVAVNPAGVTPQTYSSSIQVTPSNGSGTPAVLPVSLNVLAPAPQVTSVSPADILVGSEATTITITGSGFVNGAAIESAGSALPTQFINSTTLQLTLDKSSLTQPFTFSFSVVNPQSAPSKAITVTVGTAAPLITSVYPTTVPIGTTTRLTITGSGFASGAAVQVNGISVPTQFISGTMLQATVDERVLERPGTVPLTVVSPQALPSQTIQITVVGQPRRDFPRPRL